MRSRRGHVEAPDTPVALIGAGAFGISTIHRAQQYAAPRLNVCSQAFLLRTIAADADARHLDLVSADVKLHVGTQAHRERPNPPGHTVSHGLLPRLEGARLAHALQGVTAAIICVGLGGHAGSALAPAIAAACKTQQVPTAVFAVSPFEAEIDRRERAEAAWGRLTDLCDVSAKYSSDRLVAESSLPPDQALSISSTIISLLAVSAAGRMRHAPADRWERIRKLTRAILLSEGKILPPGSLEHSTSKGWHTFL